MAVDFRIKSYFSPSFTPGFSATQGWYDPYYLASLNLGGGNDTVPKTYQYVYDHNFDDGLRAPVESIAITKTLDQGSWAHMELVTPSDRDIFEISDNEHTTGGVHDGHMMPRMKYQEEYRTWEINLKAKADSSFPSPALFRGQLVDSSVTFLSDMKRTNQQDGKFRISLDFESFESFPLHNDIGAPMWHHIANSTTDGYHWGFFAFDKITIDDIITRIVAWMNQGRPTTDFPITYSYTPKAVAPYNTCIFNPVPLAITNTSNAADSLTFTNGSATVTGTASSRFSSLLRPGTLIRPDIDANDTCASTTWMKISSIESDTSLTLTAVWAGTTRNGVASSYNINTIAIAEVDGRPTWDILRDVLSYMGAVEGLTKKYIPTCDINGVIDITHGGYDKTATAVTDFRTSQLMNKNTSTAITFRFPLISVEYTGQNDAEYWIDFTLSKWNGSGWDVVHQTGYEYVPYDANNTHSRRYYKFPLQEAGTYKWDTDIVTAGTFGVIAGEGGGYAYTAPSYNFLSSPTKMSFRNLRTFAMTQGRCSQFGLYHNVTNKGGCYDGGSVTAGGAAKTNYCPNQRGIYPDPGATPAETVNAKYGILGTFSSYADTSERNSRDTDCRLNSKRIYECHQNTGSLIRKPIEMTIKFFDGYTTNRVGSYVNVYSPEIDDSVMLRITEQTHLLKGKRVSTTMKGFRV